MHRTRWASEHALREQLRAACVGLMSNASLLRAVLPRVGDGTFADDNDASNHTISTRETLRSAMQKFFVRCVWQEMAERRWHRKKIALLLGHHADSDDVRSVAVQLWRKRSTR